MRQGEMREIDDADVVADLLKAGYVEEVKPKATVKGRTKKNEAED